MPTFEPAEKKIVLRYIEQPKCFIHLNIFIPQPKMNQNLFDIPIQK